MKRTSRWSGSALSGLLGLTLASGVAFAWVLNLVVAEWLVRRSQAPQSGQPSRRV